jgi:hypothetical protein
MCACIPRQFHNQAQPRSQSAGCGVLHRRVTARVRVCEAQQCNRISKLGPDNPRLFRPCAATICHHSTATLTKYVFAISQGPLLTPGMPSAAGAARRYLTTWSPLYADHNHFHIRRSRTVSWTPHCCSTGDLKYNSSSGAAVAAAGALQQLGLCNDCIAVIINIIDRTAAAVSRAAIRSATQQAKPSQCSGSSRTE